MSVQLWAAREQRRNRGGDVECASIRKFARRSVRGSRSWGVELLVVVGDVDRYVGRTES